MANSKNSKASSSKAQKSGMELMFAKSDTLNRRELRKKKRMINMTIGFALIAVELVALVMFLMAIF